VIASLRQVSEQKPASWYIKIPSLTDDRLHVAHRKRNVAFSGATHLSSLTFRRFCCVLTVLTAISKAGVRESPNLFGLRRLGRGIGSWYWESYFLSSEPSRSYITSREGLFFGLLVTECESWSWNVGWDTICMLMWLRVRRSGIFLARWRFLNLIETFLKGPYGGVARVRAVEFEWGSLRERIRGVRQLARRKKLVPFERCKKTLRSERMFWQTSASWRTSASRIWRVNFERRSIAPQPKTYSNYEKEKLKYTREEGGGGSLWWWRTETHHTYTKAKIKQIKCLTIEKKN